MAFRIRIAVDAVAELNKLSATHRSGILHAIEAQLCHQPTVSTRNRKQLKGLIPPWHAVPPVWELRVDDYRVFYDVDEAEKSVYVRMIRRKPAGKTMEDIL